MIGTGAGGGAELRSAWTGGGARPHKNLYGLDFFFREFDL